MKFAEPAQTTVKEISITLYNIQDLIANVDALLIDDSEKNVSRYANDIINGIEVRNFYL